MYFLALSLAGLLYPVMCHVRFSFNPKIKLNKVTRLFKRYGFVSYRMAQLQIPGT